MKTTILQICLPRFSPSIARVSIVHNGLKNYALNTIVTGLQPFFLVFFFFKKKRDPGPFVPSLLIVNLVCNLLIVPDRCIVYLVSTYWSIPLLELGVQEFYPIFQRDHLECYPIFHPWCKWGEIYLNESKKKKSNELLKKMRKSME